ncbi:hypothetical protein FHS96_003308 [Sphingomonas zeicaulis]|uniref:beta-propeller domain-containing protein n=1 Tax=Sphingomonas zeicaulis TaxID=1632740 RepID=UPI003D215978
MKRWVAVGGLALAASAGTLALAMNERSAPLAEPAPVDARVGPKLARFASARAFAAYINASLARAAEHEGDMTLQSVPSPSVMAEPAADAAPAVADAAANPEITNNQMVGVDEGGIVKQIGRHLVVLQDGRLFSIDLGDRANAPMRLADRIDVYRSAETAASWYDEMLVLEDRILVTAYNYREQASEVTVLRMDPTTGRMRREGRFLMNSNDYYSTESYATRLVGDTLVVYTPHQLLAGGTQFAWPRLRRADGDGEADGGKALIGPTDVYAPPGEVDHPVLHTISFCPLKASLECRTTAFVGPAMREFYVSPTDAFLWIGAPDGLPWAIDYRNQRRRACGAGESWRTASSNPALLYRLPLDGGTIGALAVEGVPADQFALDSRDGRFRALLSSAGAGCAPTDATEPLALLDVPLSAFGTSIRHTTDRAYTRLPGIDGGMLENRFLGDWLVYGGRSSWSGMEDGGGRPSPASLFAVPLKRPGQFTRLSLPHNAVRIERAGKDAVVTGYRDAGGLSLSYLRLGRDAATVAATTQLPGRVESEGRSHAFNAWLRPDGSGVLGIPTSRNEGRAERGWSDSRDSDLSFVAIGTDKRLSPAGELSVAGRKPEDGYRCEISCIDWYGNARPIFTGGRMFALMGTELVEGRMAGGRIAPLQRVDLTGRVALESGARPAAAR